MPARHFWRFCVAAGFICAAFSTPARAAWTLFVSADEIIQPSDLPGVLRFDGQTGAQSSSWVFGGEDAMGLAYDSSNGNLYLSSNEVGGGEIDVVNATTGNSVPPFQMVNSAYAIPENITYGPSDTLYVTSNSFQYQSGSETGLLKFNPNTGTYGGALADSTSSPSMTSTYEMAFNNNSVYMTGDSGQFNITTSDVQKYNASTGTFQGEFVSSGEGGLSDATGLAWGADGDLFVASGNTNSVLEYSSTGSFLGTFVTPGEGGLSAPLDLAFGPDGDLYVLEPKDVLRYDATTGAFEGVFASWTDGYAHFMTFAEVPAPEPTGVGSLTAAGIFAARRRRVMAPAINGSRQYRWG